MTQINISKERSYSYDEKYEIQIKTTKKLTKEEYTTLINSIESISEVLDSHIELKLKKLQEKKEAKEVQK